MELEQGVSNGRCRERCGSGTRIACGGGMDKAIAVVAAVIVGSSAGGAIIPVQCVRGSGAEILGNDSSGDVNVQDYAERPFPPNSLANWDGHATASTGAGRPSMCSGRANPRC